jgi:hypothetical protein
MRGQGLARVPQNAGRSGAGDALTNGWSVGEHRDGLVPAPQNSGARVTFSPSSASLNESWQDSREFSWTW